MVIDYREHVRTTQVFVSRTVMAMDSLKSKKFKHKENLNQNVKKILHSLFNYGKPLVLVSKVLLTHCNFKHHHGSFPHLSSHYPQVRIKDK